MNAKAKPIFLQSQLLEGMITNAAPSRQELTEITASTLDGVDCLMLCHETSIGNNGTAAVTALAKGIAEAENVFDHEQAFVNIRETVKAEGINASSIDVLTSTSMSIAFEKDSDVDMVICFTENGKIARFLSKQRPKQPILACSTNGQVVR